MLCGGCTDPSATVPTATTAPIELIPAPDELPSSRVDTGQPSDASDSAIELTSIEFEIGDESGPQPVPGVQLAVLEEEVIKPHGGKAEAKKAVKHEPAEALLKNWPTPKFALFVTGRQHGYIEPCGCSGLENAKGGLSRRHSMLNLLRDRGWNMVAVDVGNQVRRFGKQAEIKFDRTVSILRLMQYDAIGFGPDDLRMAEGILSSVSDGGFVCCNVSLFDLNLPYVVVEAGGSRIGITSVLGKAEQKKIDSNSDVTLSDPATALRKVLGQMKAEGSQFQVLLAHASLEETRELVRQFPDSFDVVVTAGGAGEPTLEPERLPGSKSQVIQVGYQGNVRRSGRRF